MMYRDLFSGIKNAYQRVKDRVTPEETPVSPLHDKAMQVAEATLNKYNAPKIVRDFTVDLIDRADRAGVNATSAKDAFVSGAAAGLQSVAYAAGQAVKRGVNNIADKVNGMQKPNIIPNYSKPTTNISVQTLPYTGGAVQAQNLPFHGNSPQMQNLPANTTPYKFKYADILKYLRR